MKIKAVIFKLRRDSCVINFAPRCFYQTSKYGIIVRYGYHTRMKKYEN